MMIRVLLTTAVVLAVPAIGTSSAPALGPWATPVPFEPANSAGRDAPNGVSADGLTLYFQRGDPAATDPSGREDIWVVRRPHVFARWGEPQKLPDTVNSDANERGARLSPNGHYLFFASDRPGGRGGFDLMVSWRLSVFHDSGPLGWRQARNLDDLGAPVNTPGFDSGPSLFRDRRGRVQLYFVSNPAGTQAQADVYVSVLQSNGTFGAPALVPELSSPASEGAPEIRRDGLEIYFQSNRPGGLGGFDLWRATRASVDEPWSTPEDVAELNTPDNEFTPVLSSSGLTLFFGREPLTVRNGDVYLATRTWQPRR